MLQCHLIRIAKPFNVFLISTADCDHPGDYFLTFFDEEIRESILYQTNLYITQSMKTTPHVTRALLLPGNQHGDGISSVTIVD